MRPLLIFCSFYHICIASLVALMVKNISSKKNNLRNKILGNLFSPVLPPIELHKPVLRRCVNQLIILFELREISAPALVFRGLPDEYMINFYTCQPGMSQKLNT